MAAASQNCVATVWDLRNNQTLFNVHDNTYINKSLCSALAWNPDIPTQFIMAYNDQDNPNLQIWDLRKHEQPVKELKSNHKTGVTALSWCPHDSAIFASSDRSGFTVLWNFKQGQSFMKIEHSFKSPNAIKWVPKSPGLIAFGNEDGDIEFKNIYTPLVTSGVKIAHSDDPTDFVKPEVVFTPKWVPRKIGAHFGYNGKLVTFTSSSNLVHINTIKTQVSSVKEKIEKVHKLYIEGKHKELCNYFSEHTDEETKLQWEIISAKLFGNISGILSLLGFDRKAIEKSTEKHTGKKRGHNEDFSSGKKDTFHDTFTFVDLSGVDAEDFFNKAGAKKEEFIQQVETLKTEPEFLQTISETISKVVFF